MIVVLKHGVEAAKREQLIDWLILPPRRVMP